MLWELFIKSMLAVCFGMRIFFSTVGISFPPSVACMIIFFILLLCSEALLGTRPTNAVVGLIKGDWALKLINNFFAPAFIMFPTSPPIAISEVMKIIAVFCESIQQQAPGLPLIANLTQGLRWILHYFQRAPEMRRDEDIEEPLRSSACPRLST
ncbi:unnamed protein product [Clonostachys rhizophaga]|uniref:Uncharacterized protein n=1 Tax=Clonostachys rhizophaga TaxID=160324 RepID=A0A9N9YFC9_9HYPO|nr:unnamed protein product [Clonostachys rhizophaga]